MKVLTYLALLLIATISAHSSEYDYTLLVTGCGKSGTTFVSGLLRNAGLDIGHERLRKDGISSWFMAVENKYEPCGFVSKGLKFAHIFHQIRHPLDVISAWNKNNITPEKNPHTWHYIYTHISNEGKKYPPIGQYAMYWYYWNLEAMKKSEWTYRIEDIDIIFEEMEQRLGVPLNRSALQIVSWKQDGWTNVPENRRVTWADLEKILTPEDLHRVQSLAIRYRYAIN